VKTNGRPKNLPKITVIKKAVAWKRLEVINMIY
jgi:hypothetical protein